MQHCVPGNRQRGAAIVTVLLIVTLATVVVSSLFWREHVAVRSVENRLALAQTRWIERAAVDYARVILRTSLIQTPNRVDLGQIWATPVERTPMDETVTAGGRVEDRSRALAEISGRIYDAQGRFNLNNLVGADGKPDEKQIKAFERLLSSFGKSASLATQLAERLARALPPPPAGVPTPGATQTGGTPATGGASTTGSGQTETARRPATALRMKRLSDLLEIPGFDQDTIDRLSEHVIFLPSQTKTLVNINTATSEVIAALVEGSNIAQARNFTSKLRAHTSLDLAKQELAGGNATLSTDMWDTKSQYFLLRGQVHYDRVYTQIDALLQRQPNSGLVKVIWQDRY